jgi:hypothetical protein
MTTFTAGVVYFHDFNETSLCLKYGLHIDNKEKCKNITNMMPSEMGTLLFYQVGYLIQYKKLLLNRKVFFLLFKTLCILLKHVSTETEK